MRPRSRAASRGTPRVAARLLRRVRDFAAVAGVKRIDAAAADAALQRLEVDASGLDALDRRYLLCIVQNYGGGPVGVETVAAALGDQRDVIEEVIEPYLVQQGFVQRTAARPRADRRGLRASRLAAAASAAGAARSARR